MSDLVATCTCPEGACEMQLNRLCARPPLPGMTPTVADFQAACTKLASELEEAVGLMRVVEWNGQQGRCPWCGSRAPKMDARGGHETFCGFYAFLARHPPKAP